MCIGNIIKDYWHYLPIAAIMGVGIQMLRKWIIKKEATQMMCPLLKEIRRKFKKDGSFRNTDKIPQGRQNELGDTIIAQPGETVEVKRSISIFFNDVGKTYHRSFFKKLLHQMLLIDGDDIKKRCFEELQKSGRLRRGQGDYDFTFWKDDNRHLFKIKQLYAVIWRKKSV
jgi:hypothetical protein